MNNIYHVIFFVMLDNISNYKYDKNTSYLDKKGKKFFVQIIYKISTCTVHI